MAQVLYRHEKEFTEAVERGIQPWVEWKHIPRGKTHCKTCLRLDGCWFQELRMPHNPLHEYCHCTVTSKSVLRVRSQAEAKSEYSKYDPYLFDPKGAYKHGKDKLFRLWGYTEADALWLKEEIERQGLENYLAGNYMLNKLNESGQRINIVITIPRKDKEGVASFTTGWMVEPQGKIRLVTPYGDA